MDDVDGMLRWSLGPGRKPPEFLKRCSEIRLKRERGQKQKALGSDSSGASLVGDADWAEFQRSRADQNPKDQASQIQDLEEHLAFADFALRRARERGDEPSQKKYSEEVIKFSKAVKEQKLLADRLGLESGELLPRAQAEAFFSAHAYWTMRSVDMAIDALSRRLVNLSFPEEARAVMEPELLSAKFISAYARAAQIDSPSALPSWAIVKIRDAVDDYIEDGAAQFDAAASTTAAPPTQELTDGSGI